MSDEKTETAADETKAEGEKAGGFDKWVLGLTDEQLAAVKATVNTVAEQRQEPGYGAMSNNELRKDVSKRFGYNPKV